MPARQQLINGAAIILGLLLVAFVVGEGLPAVIGEQVGQIIDQETIRKPTLDVEEYDSRMAALANIPAPPDDETEGAEPTEAETEEVDPPLWPVEAPYPNYGAILPFHRILAYYGNFYSTRMGILGEFDEETVLKRMQKEIDAWEAADPDTPVMPAIEYIAITAQLAPQPDNTYRLRMPHHQIDKAVEMAKKIDAIVILDVQPGLSDVMTEVRTLEPYLKLPQVHLAIDPEFAMRRTGARPGTRVGTVNAEEMNEVANYLAELVKEHDLPPKVLVIHRYTRAMVSNATDIEPLPEVQIVMDMDGWGTPSQKFATYNAYIAPYPVQFTGFKVFYKNDRRLRGSRLLAPEEILGLTPRPIFIQYQ